MDENFLNLNMGDEDRFLDHHYQDICIYYKESVGSMAKWFMANKKADFEKIAKDFHISPELARLIRNRDVCGEEEIRKFLHGTKEDLYAPSLLKDMDRAVEVIRNAIAEHRKIRVIGDYDIDGVCASYILVRAFRSLGADADTAIPHRVKDGYGLNDHLIKQAAADGVGLIVTCDNGIAAADQIKLAHELGMQVVVTDHHEVPFTENAAGGRVCHMPEAEAVIDPKQPGETYPFAGICGAVVAYKLVWALGIDEGLLDSFLEPAAFATVGDVVELKDENRIIVKEGMRRMRRTSHPGLRALIEANKLDMEKIEPYHIGFVLGPCINASGRLESAALSLQLWLEENYERAVPIAAELKRLNESRKEMTEEGVRGAVQMLERSETLQDGAAAQNVRKERERDGIDPDQTDKVIVLYLPDCHESLAGIIAGRIKERYHRPALVFTDTEEGVKGSGRSIEAYDLYAELSACKDLFQKFGGHKMAAGVSLPKEHLAELRRRLNENCTLTEDDFQEKLHIDAELPASRVSETLIQELEQLAPFGTGNRKPLFGQRNVFLCSGRILGQNRNVTKFNARDGEGNHCTLVYFGDADCLENYLSEKYGEDAGRLFSGGGVALPLTIAYFPRINEYNGRREIEIVVSNYK